MELYARNLYVNGNTISHYPAAGIDALSVLDATITGNHVYDTGKEFLSGDIKAETRFPGGECDAYRNIQGLYIENNDRMGHVSQQFGIYLGDGREGSTNVIEFDNIGFTGTIGANGGPAFLDKRVTLTPPNRISTESTLAWDGPEAIAVFPQCSKPLGNPLGPLDPNLGNRRFFRFGANHPEGPASFNQVPPLYKGALQGFLGTLTESHQGGGAGGPYLEQPAYLCNFEYVPHSGTSGTIYLDGDSARFTWSSGSSPIGAGGIDLYNNACKIHAATSSVVQGVDNGSPHNLMIILDIEFLHAGTWYMYESAQDNQDRVNAGSGGAPPWSYWGYWLAPLMP